LYGSFEPTDRWVPDLSDLLIENKLNAITFEGEKITHDTLNYLVFGIGKPKIYVKIDNATQTDETNNEQSGNTLLVLIYNFKRSKKVWHIYIIRLKINITQQLTKYYR